MSEIVTFVGGVLHGQEREKAEPLPRIAVPYWAGKFVNENYILTHENNETAYLVEHLAENDVKTERCGECGKVL